jgi:hypothetical protein
MPIHNIPVYENEAVEGVQSKVKKSTEVRTKFVGEGIGGASSNATLFEEFQFMDARSNFERLVKERGLTVSAPGSAVVPVGRSVAPAGEGETPSAFTDTWLQLLKVERQLATLQEEVFPFDATSLELLEDAERIVARYPADRDRVNLSLKALDSKIDQVKEIGKPYRLAMIQSTEDYAELLLDATATLLNYRKLQPIASSLDDDLDKLKELESSWGQLKEDLALIDEAKVSESEAKLDELEAKVVAVEKAFQTHKSGVLQQLEAFEKEISARLAVPLVLGAQDAQ